MDNFYMNLKNLDNPNYLEEHISEFNTLNDGEIKLLFDDKTISPDFKTIFANICVERIRNLPFNIFMTILFYVESINEYRDRIEKLSYQELVSLIYEVDLDRDCIIEITKMEVFRKYLKYEKENFVGTKLQSFEILKQLYLSDNINELNTIGVNIINLLQNSFDYSDDMEDVIEFYLTKVIEKNDDINLDSNINNIGISLMNYYLKNHKELNSKLVEFYVLFHLKELNLQDLCKQVIVTDYDSSIFGNYTPSTKILKIFNNHIKKRFEPFFKLNRIQDENSINDFINLIKLTWISHELYHVSKYKEVEEYEKFSTNYENIKNNISLYYWYRNGLLHMFLGENQYMKNHDSFIEENRADIFAAFDSNIQINKYFKNSFSETKLQNLCMNNACNILRFYTRENADGEKTIMSPIQKFNMFYYSYITDEDKMPNLETDYTPDNIMNNLLLGNSVPEIIIEEYSKIANGTIRITDIYEYTLKTIEKMRVTNLEQSKTQNKL